MSESSTQSPTEEETVAAQHRKTLSSFFAVYISWKICLIQPNSCTFNAEESFGLLVYEQSPQVPGVRDQASTRLQDR